MAVDVSVVIPLFNPGANIEDCLASMLVQTLGQERFEVILVDDGSTDGSAERIDQWAACHPGLARVHHIAASGGPARPRNVGIESSRGRFIQFVDSDDTLAAGALERLIEIADESDADVVVGKISSGGPRGLYHPIFRRTVTRRTLSDYLPLIQNGTICKMFRRDFLLKHHVRFPEGPRYIEDQHLGLHAYAHAESVAVVADMVCYFHKRRRTGGHHFGDAIVVPSDYFHELGDIFDLVDTHIPTAAVQRAAHDRFYRNEMLGRLRGAAMLAYDADYRRDLVWHMRKLATTRLPRDFHAGLPVFSRAQSRLLLDNDIDGLVDFARRLEAVRIRASTSAPVWQDGRLLMHVDAPLHFGDRPFRLEHDDKGWLLPESMAPTVGADDRRLRAIDEADLDLATISRSDSQLWSTTRGLRLTIDDYGCPRVRGDVSLNPGTVMGGAALSPGVWDLRLRVIIGGLPRTSPLRPATLATHRPDTWLTTTRHRLHSVTAFWAAPLATLTLDVDEWAHPLHDLVVDQLVATPKVDGRRRVSIAAPGLRGPKRDAGHTSLILELLDSAEAGPVTCKADLLIRPDGSTIRATIPRLPPTSRRWAMSLQIGDIGGPPPRRLPFELNQSRSGRLRVTREDEAAKD